MSIMLSLRAERLLALRPGLAGFVAHPGQPGQPLVRLHRPPTAAPAPFPLARAATHWVARPRGQVVTCEAGTLWLTFDGERRDIVLDAGESHRCDSDARLAIHALAAARVHLGPASTPR
jgi:hypothetical protein